MCELHTNEQTIHWQQSYSVGSLSLDRNKHTLNSYWRGSRRRLHAGSLVSGKHTHKWPAAVSLLAICKEQNKFPKQRSCGKSHTGLLVVGGAAFPACHSGRLVLAQEQAARSGFWWTDAEARVLPLNHRLGGTTRTEHMPRLLRSPLCTLHHRGTHNAGNRFYNPKARVEAPGWKATACHWRVSVLLAAARQKLRRRNSVPVTVCYESSSSLDAQFRIWSN